MYKAQGFRLGNNHGQTVQWDLVDKPTSIATAKGTVSFAYNVNKRRYIRADDSNSSKRLYLNQGSAEYHITPTGVKTVYYIHTHDYSPVAQVNGHQGSIQYTYFAKDHLGTPLTRIADNGDAQRKERHDPWGQTTQANGAADEPQDNRAFTGHETIAAANMIHMNGRVYDPKISQFLRGDKYRNPKQALMGINPYLYLNNRPTHGTDPTGWINVFTPEARLALGHFRNANHDVHRIQIMRLDALHSRPERFNFSVENHNFTVVHIMNFHVETPEGFAPIDVAFHQSASPISDSVRDILRQMTEQEQRLVALTLNDKLTQLERSLTGAEPLTEPPPAIARQLQFPVATLVEPQRRRPFGRRLQNLFRRFRGLPPELPEPSVVGRIVDEDQISRAVSALTEPSSPGNRSNRLTGSFDTDASQSP